MIERYRSHSAKVYASTTDELVCKINALKAREIRIVQETTPDETTTKHCFRVVYAKDF